MGLLLRNRGEASVVLGAIFAVKFANLRTNNTYFLPFSTRLLFAKPV